jgi:hypothetical protein
MVSINEYRKIEMTDNLKGGFIPLVVVRYREKVNYCLYLLIVVDKKIKRNL